MMKGSVPLWQKEKIKPIKAMLPSLKKAKAVTIKTKAQVAEILKTTKAANPSQLQNGKVKRLCRFVILHKSFQQSYIYMLQNP